MRTLLLHIEAGVRLHVANLDLVAPSLEVRRWQLDADTAGACLRAERRLARWCQSDRRDGFPPRTGYALGTFASSAAVSAIARARRRDSIVHANTGNSSAAPMDTTAMFAMPESR